MSDGVLSQDEIDALLGGDAIPSMPSDVDVSGQNASDSMDLSGIIELLDPVADNLGESLTATLSKKVSSGKPDIQMVVREDLLTALPDEIVEFKSNFKGGLTGIHLHLISRDDALKIATSMIGQDGLELDETTIGAVGEAVNQINGISLAAIGEKVSDAILPDVPEGQVIPRESISLPEGQIIQAIYNVEVEDQGSIEIREIFDLDMLGSFIGRQALSSDTDSLNSFKSLMGTAPAANQMSNSGQVSFNTSMSSGLDSPLLGVSGDNASARPNVQGIQLPNLSPLSSAGEKRNIGLLMDVSMELSVELGRTKWKIKDILGIGEGTIVELDKLAGEPVDILVNNNLLAKGEVVVIDENFGVRITEIVTTIDRMTEH